MSSAVRMTAVEPRLSIIAQEYDAKNGCQYRQIFYHTCSQDARLNLVACLFLREEEPSSSAFFTTLLLPSMNSVLSVSLSSALKASSLCVLSLSASSIFCTISVRLLASSAWNKIQFCQTNNSKTQKFDIMRQRACTDGTLSSSLSFKYANMGPHAIRLTPSSKYELLNRKLFVMCSPRIFITCPILWDVWQELYQHCCSMDIWTVCQDCCSQRRRTVSSHHFPRDRTSDCPSLWYHCHPRILSWSGQLLIQCHHEPGWEYFKYQNINQSLVNWINWTHNVFQAKRLQSGYIAQR